MKKILALMLALVMVFALAACGEPASEETTPATEPAGEETTPATEPAEEPEEVSGNVTLNGSTSMESVILALIEGFADVQPGVSPNYTGSGSGAGIEGVLAGTCDLGLASRALSDEEKERLKGFFLLTAKPVIYACNVSEDDISAAEPNAYVKSVAEYASKEHGASSCVICARLEEELGELSKEESEAFLKEMGLSDSGVGELIRRTYDLLGLASYFTAGEKEVRAWTFVKGMTAPQCAGVIHTDFERGFIKAEVVSYDDLIKAGSIAAAREAGTYRLEGKDYKFADGDVALFRFNV